MTCAGLSPYFKAVIAFQWLFYACDQYTLSTIIYKRFHHNSHLAFADLNCQQYKCIVMFNSKEQQAIAEQHFVVINKS